MHKKAQMNLLNYLPKSILPILIITIFFVACKDDNDTIPKDNENSLSGTFFYKAESQSNYLNNIYSMKADGTGEKQLTFFDTSAIDVFSMKYSRQADKLFFVSNIDSLRKPEIYSMNTDGSNITRITNNNLQEQDPILSNDGSKILFIGFKSGTDYSANIYTINIDGSNLTAIPKFNPDKFVDFFTGLDWSPDNSKIVFCGYPTLSSDREIYTMNSNGSNLTRLTFDHLTPISLKFSNNGDKILYTAINDSVHFSPPFTPFSQLEIYSIDIAGNNLNQITNVYIDTSRAVSYEALDGMWSANDQKLVFNLSTHSDKLDLKHLYQINVDGSNMSRITNDLTRRYHLCWKYN